MFMCVVLVDFLLENIYQFAGYQVVRLATIASSIGDGRSE